MDFKNLAKYFSTYCKINMIWQFIPHPRSWCFERFLCTLLCGFLVLSEVSRTRIVAFSLLYQSSTFEKCRGVGVKNRSPWDCWGEWFALLESHITVWGLDGLSALPPATWQSHQWSQKLVASPVHVKSVETKQTQNFE